MRPLMSRRLLPLALVLAVFAAACAEAPVEPTFGSGESFVAQVVDPLNDAGRYPSVAVVDGRPVVAYFSFAEEVEEGSFPQTRPIGLPSIPGVMLATVQDGIWTRGAIAIEEQINNVQVAFNPAFAGSVAKLTPDSVTGLQLVAASDGGLHAVWGSADGVFYATGSADPASTTPWIVEKVTSTPGIGPSLAVDEGGVPWIAYYTSTSAIASVEVATPGGDEWTIETADSAPGCAGCRTAIAVDGDGDPVVGYGDGPHVTAAVGGDGWTTTTIERRGAGLGLAAARAADGSIVFAYETATQVHAARGDGGSAWQVAEVAELRRGAGGPGTTSVAVDDAGTTTVAWYDPTADAVSAAMSSDFQTFAPIDLGLTDGARDPAVATTADGASRYVVWYDSGPQDLVLAAYGDAGDLAIGVPSPTPTDLVQPSTAPTQECTPVVDGKVTVVAEGLAFTDGNCIQAPAGEPFTIVFDNRDSDTQHNVQVFGGSEASGDTLFSGELITGPAQTEYEIPALDAGEYAYNCLVHPTMIGKIVVGGEGTGATGSTGTTGATGATGAGSMVMVTAQGVAFDTSTITLAADVENTIMLDNQDAGVQHNIAIHTDSSMTEELFNGDLVTGVASIEYAVPALPAGEYYFVCIVHTNMNGTVIVQ